jgi:hypothetical protein
MRVNETLRLKTGFCAKDLRHNIAVLKTSFRLIDILEYTLKTLLDLENGQRMQNRKLIKTLCLFSCRSALMECDGVYKNVKKKCINGN